MELGHIPSHGPFCVFIYLFGLENYVYKYLDIPMENNEGDQVHRQSNPKEVQGTI